MFSYFIGKIQDIDDDNNIIIETNNIGYSIKVPKATNLIPNQEIKLYTYLHIKENVIELYGFKDIFEKTIFQKLLNVNGIGTKSALNFLNIKDLNTLIDAINNEDYIFLKSFPQVGNKLSQQIILDLKGKISFKKEYDSDLVTIKKTLKNIGYKEIDINNIIPKINKSHNIDEMLKDALKLLINT